LRQRQSLKAKRREGSDRNRARLNTIPAVQGILGKMDLECQGAPSGTDNRRGRRGN